MDSILPLRRFASWVIDKLMFLAMSAAILFLVNQLDSRLGIVGPDSVNFDLYDFLAIQMPLALLVTYVLWMLLIIKVGPPGRLFTGTQVSRHRGGGAGFLRKFIRAVVKVVLHLTVIGLILDAVFILRDQRERRSIADLMAGTIITSRRR